MGLLGKEIKNYPKKGYALVADVKFETIEEDKPQAASEIDINPLNKKAYVIPVLIILVFILFALAQPKNPTDHIPPVLNQAIQLLDDKYEKIDLATNNETNQVAYATRESKDEYWYLVLMDTYSLKTKKIAYLNFNLRTPDWIDSETLVFRAYNDNDCSIKQLDLSKPQAKPVSLFPCNKLTTGKGLSVLDQNTILFTDAALDIAPAYLYQGDITTGKVSRIPNFESKGVGSYNIQASHKSDLVAILNGPDWTSTDIHLIDRTQDWQSVWHINVPDHKFSVSWNGSSLIHTNDKGGVTAHLFDNKQYLKNIEMSGFSKLYNLVGAGDSVAFLRGNMYRADIYMSSITNQNSASAPIVDTRASNRLAQFISVNLISYVSDITGIEQLWSVDTKTKIRRQISAFETSRVIEAINFSEEHNLYAVEANQQISIYKYVNEKLSKEPIFSISGGQPLFYNDWLLYVTKDEHDNYNINAYDLKTERILRPFVIGAHEAKVSDGQLYYTKYYQPGLWKYQPENEDPQVFEMSQDVDYWFIDGEELLFKPYGQNHFIADLSSGEVKSFTQTRCHLITDYQYGKCLGQQFRASSTQLMLAETIN